MTSKSQMMCDGCAIALGATYVATYHLDYCGVCGECKAVTETRDFSWKSVSPETTQDSSGG